MSRGNGQILLVALLLSFFVVNLNRPLFDQQEGPVALSGNGGYVAVELGRGFRDRSIHQFIDGTPLSHVMKLTDRPVARPDLVARALAKELLPGQRVDLVIKNGHIEGLTVSWMSAAKRIAVGIPLHPDRMSQSDWQVLPGIGKKMARRIEQDRQKYGDFGTFGNLRRVSGIGEKRLTSWNQYFFSNTPSS